MVRDKTQRDAINNQRFQDTYVHASQEPWIEFYPGIGFKLLRATQETGHWSASELRKGLQHSPARTSRGR
jgi:hypothetical protein